MNEGGAKKKKGKKNDKAKKLERAKRAAEEKARKLERAKRAAEEKARKLEQARKAAEAKKIEQAKRAAEAEAKRIEDVRKAAEEKIYQDFNDALKESEKQIEKARLTILARSKAKKRSKKAKKKKKRGFDVEDDPNILAQEILALDYEKFLNDLETEEKKILEEREKNIRALEIYLIRTEKLKKKRNIRKILNSLDKNKFKSFLVSYKKIKKNIDQYKQQINNNKVKLDRLFDKKSKDVVKFMEVLTKKNNGIQLVDSLIRMISDDIKKIEIEIKEDYLENKSELQKYELKIYNILKGNIKETYRFPKFKLKIKDMTKLMDNFNFYIMILYLFVEVSDYRFKIQERRLEDDKIRLLREFLTYNIHNNEKMDLVSFISIIVKRAMIQVLFESDEKLKSQNNEKSISPHNKKILLLLKSVNKKVKDKTKFYRWVDLHYQLLSEKSFDYANAIDIRKRNKNTLLDFTLYRSNRRKNTTYSAEIISHNVRKLSDSILNSYVVLINNNDRKYIDIVYHNEKIFKVSEVVELIYRRTRNGKFIFEIISEPVVKLELDELEMF